MTEKQQKAYIKANYCKMSTKQMARDIGRSSYYVFSYMRKNNLIVPEEIKKTFIKQSQFKKGHEPFNKGLALESYTTEEARERMKETQYKKGNEPHNTRCDYDVSLRSLNSGYAYYYIRIKKARWILLHRYIWEIYNGPIPKGHNIQFHDGDSRNVDIENLYMISRKKQVFLNGYGGNALSPELKETIDLIYQLKSKINEKQSD